MRGGELLIDLDERTLDVGFLLGGHAVGAYRQAFDFGPVGRGLCRLGFFDESGLDRSSRTAQCETAAEQASPVQKTAAGHAGLA
jgi:hypothetical protein